MRKRVVMRLDGFVQDVQRLAWGYNFLWFAEKKEGRPGIRLRTHRSQTEVHWKKDEKKSNR